MVSLSGWTDMDAPAALEVEHRVNNVIALPAPNDASRDQPGAARPACVFQPGHPAKLSVGGNRRFKRCIDGKRTLCVRKNCVFLKKSAPRLRLKDDFGAG